VGAVQEGVNFGRKVVYCQKINYLSSFEIIPTVVFTKKKSLRISETNQVVS
jgi:hypothetical protein